MLVKLNILQTVKYKEMSDQSDEEEVNDDVSDMVSNLGTGFSRIKKLIDDLKETLPKIDQISDDQRRK